MKKKNPMHHVKRCEGLPRQIPVGNWYHVGTYNLQQKDFCRVGMKKPNMFSSQSSSAWSCAQNQILENKILETEFWIFVLNDK